MEKFGRLSYQGVFTLLKDDYSRAEITVLLADADRLPGTPATMHGVKVTQHGATYTVEVEG